jgi:hypothetical protein
MDRFKKSKGESSRRRSLFLGQVREWCFQIELVTGFLLKLEEAGEQFTHQRFVGLILCEVFHFHGVRLDVIESGHRNLRVEKQFFPFNRDRALDR